MKQSLIKHVCAGAASLLLMVSLLVLPAWKAIAIAAPPTLLAYNIDQEMDQARKEKTVEHYGEGIRDIVEDATENNVNNPNKKSTAESTYKRENPLIDVLPKQIGKDFSQEDLADMENSN